MSKIARTYSPNSLPHGVLKDTILTDQTHTHTCYLEQWRERKDENPKIKEKKNFFDIHNRFVFYLMFANVLLYG